MKIIIASIIVASLLLTTVTTATSVYAGGKGLKLYLTVDNTNLRSQDINIETYQYGDRIYNHNGFMSTGSNEYTLNYPRHLVDNGPFEICIKTNDGRFCDNGYNSEEKKPESVFINAQEGRNFGSVPTDSQSQSQASSQEVEQETSQSQSQSQGGTTIINCPANSKCVIEN